VRINIMRPSSLGNPLPLTSESSRQENIALYKIHLEKHWRQQTPTVVRDINNIRAILGRGIDIELACGCKPKECHGDVIKEFIEGLRMPVELLTFTSLGYYRMTDHTTVHVVKNPSICNDFGHITGQLIYLDGNRYRVTQIKHFDHPAPFMEGEALGLIVERP
jgi:hypothetical protein